MSKITAYREMSLDEKKKRRVGLSVDLSDELLKKIENSKVDPHYNHLNDLLKGWEPKQAIDHRKR